MKYKIILVCIIVMLITCACSNSINYTQTQTTNQLETTVTSSENSAESTVTTVEDIEHVFERVYGEMLPWQIEGLNKNNIHREDLEAYLEEKGAMNEWLKSKYGDNAYYMQESNTQKQIVDNLHRTWNFPLQRRDAMFALITEEYNQINYTIVVAIAQYTFSVTLVMSDTSNNIIHWVGGGFPQSSGFYANVVEWPECTVLFGLINPERLGGSNYDRVLPIDFSDIKVFKDENEILLQSVSAPGVVLMVFDAGTKITDYQMLNQEGQIAETQLIHYITFDEKGRRISKLNSNTIACMGLPLRDCIYI